MNTQVTLKNGVWVHETEWAAIMNLISKVRDFVSDPTAQPMSIQQAKLADAWWCWKHSEMDIHEQSRVIRSLTNLVGELTSDEDDVTLTSML